MPMASACQFSVLVGDISAPGNSNEIVIGYNGTPIYTSTTGSFDFNRSQPKLRFLDYGSRNTAPNPNDFPSTLTAPNRQNLLNIRHRTDVVARDIYGISRPMAVRCAKSRDPECWRGPNPLPPA